MLGKGIHGFAIFAFQVEVFDCIDKSVLFKLSALCGPRLEYQKYLD